VRALADAKLEPKGLDQVVLVGGQTRMPLVRQLVGQWFAGRPINTSQNPDEAVALGAAIQAEILSGGFKNVLLLDVTPLSLGIETFGGLMNVIIPRNTTIPVKAGEMFTTAVDNQRNILIHVLQGERDRAKDNWSLGKFTIDFQPAPKGIPRVGVQFEIDANGILHVLARDTKTGQQKVVEIKSAVDVDDAAVQRMVEESVEHAFEDMAARQWIEAKLRAEQTVAATHKALKDSPDEYRNPIEVALKNLEALLANESGDLKKLKAAHAALDEATRPLAELLMDRAMEAMLRKQGIIS
jgi:molecular chaperone DnaK